MVEPVDPFQGGKFHGFEVAPWPASVDDLGLVKPVDGFGERIVVTVADASDRGFDACFGQSFGVFDRQILPAAIRMVNETASMDGAAIMECLFKGIADKGSMRGAAGAPTNDATGEDINDESDIDRAMGAPLVRETMARPVPCADIGEIRDPQNVGSPIVGKTIPRIVF